MSTAQCAHLKLNSAFSGRYAAFLFNIQIIILACGLLLLVFCPPCFSEDTQTIVLKVMLNHEDKGDFFVILTDKGDFLFKTLDLKAMGFREPKGRVSEINGENYISLQSMKGVTYHFDDTTITLEIDALPSLLPKYTLDLMPRRRPDVSFTSDKSAFLNYRFTYSGNSALDSRDFNVVNELGFSGNNFLFFTDSTYTNSTSEEKFVRLTSNITYDNRSTMNRFVAGDFSASSGVLGSIRNMGGISCSKVYQIRPYFLQNPLLSISGATSLSSDVDIYLDGMKIKSAKLQPGEFELKDLSYYGGAHDVQVVLTDPFGKETVINRPFYFTDMLLREGLHEYSYNLGFLREDFGIESNTYSDPALFVFHRYGLSDVFNIGFRAEGGKGLFNLGPQASFMIDNAGILSMALSGSHDNGRAGFAGLLNYVYQDRNFNAQVLLRGFSEDYSTIENSVSAEKKKYFISAGIGYATRQLGTFSLNAATEKKYDGADIDTITAVYTKNLSPGATLFATFSNVNAEESSNEFFIGITYYFGRDYSLSAGYRKSEDGNAETVKVQKNPPVGEGLGFRVSLDRTEQNDSVYSFNPSLQYNSRYGIFRGEYRGRYNEAASSDEYQFSAASALAYVGNTLGVTRPIAGSFGLVKVGEIDNISVYVNNQEIGKTDTSGKVFVPNLNSYYDNEVSINNGDIPIDYSISEITKYISPSLKNGAFIKFDVTKIQAVTGILKVKIDDKIDSVEFQEINMVVGDKKVTFPTGRGGEFYFENIKPGKYRASFQYFNKGCSFDIIIPESHEMLIDIGEIICEDIR